MIIWPAGGSAKSAERVVSAEKNAVADSLQHPSGYTSAQWESCLKDKDAEIASLKKELSEYKQRESRRAKEEFGGQHLQILAYILAGALLVLVLVLIHLKFRQHREDLEHLVTREYLRKLQDYINSAEDEDSPSSAEAESREDAIAEVDEDRESAKGQNTSRVCEHDTRTLNLLKEMKEVQSSRTISRKLRDEVRDNLESLLAGGEERRTRNLEKISGSAVYEAIRQRLRESKAMPEKDDLWIELEEEVERLSPDFKNIVEALADKRPDTIDWHLLLLIKCGLRPSDMTTLLCLSPSGISTRRSRLSVKVFGDKMPPAQFDRLITVL